MRQIAGLWNALGRPSHSEEIIYAIVQNIKNNSGRTSTKVAWTGCRVQMKETK
jgi:hypothetical protein